MSLGTLGRPLVVYVAILAAVVLIIWGRLRELALAGAPLSLWGPFARPLLSSAFEMALIAGVPVAVLTGWAAGLSPRRIVVLGGALALLSAGAAAALDPGNLPPGYLAQQLIDAARQSCPTAPDRRVQIPLLPAAWTCAPGQPPQVVGAIPQVATAKFRADSLRVSADLHRLALRELRLEVPRAGERPALRLAVRTADFRGLPPWGRPANVPLGIRLLTSLLQAGATTLVGLAVCRRLAAGFATALGLGVAAGVVSLGVQQLLDRLGTGVLGELVAIPVGAASIALFAGSVFVARRALRRVAAGSRGW